MLSKPYCFNSKTSIWAYWGALENFHEGWYSESLMENLFMFLFQYMSFSILFVVLALVILRWKRFGLLLHTALGILNVSPFFGIGAYILLRETGTEKVGIPIHHRNPTHYCASHIRSPGN